MMKWDRVTIETSNGQEEAMAPLIISASRSTDIPAFYSDWFVNRLDAGYLRWINPFNRQSYLVSLAGMKGVVFWTKNPEPLMKHLDRFDSEGFVYYFQVTLNDYVLENLEPGVPALSKRIETFKELAKKLGRDRVIWRFDPLILTETLSPEILMARIRILGRDLLPFTRKFVFSFADIQEYVKVRRNLRAADVNYKSFPETVMKEFAHQIAEMCQEYDVIPATCGEKIDLSEFGIVHNQCVDPHLFAELTDDEEFRKFLGYEKTLYGLETRTGRKNLKDRGQREVCGCIVSKDIGQYDTCPHLCRYCYANTSEKVVRKNYAGVKPDSESII